jgi:hypothetical protein
MNTIVLALDSHPIDPDLEFIIESTNLGFCFIFMAEMIIKLLAMGFISYFRDWSNIFDFVIIILSIFDLIIYVL